MANRSQKSYFQKDLEPQPQLTTRYIIGYGYAPRAWEDRVKSSILICYCGFGSSLCFFITCCRRLSDLALEKMQWLLSSSGW